MEEVGILVCERELDDIEQDREDEVRCRDPEERVQARDIRTCGVPDLRLAPCKTSVG